MMNRNKLLIGGALVAVVAGVLIFVLPAETGRDPTGLGGQLGLTDMSDPPNEELERGMLRTGVLELTDSPPPPQDGVRDSWEYELGPFESIEFKYVLPEGQPMSFAWSATSQVEYDLHAHPFDGGTELTESYAISRGTAQQGIYNPAFTGEHGWYWENRSLDNVTVRLEASGAIAGSVIYAPGARTERPIEGATPIAEGAPAGHEMQAASAE